MNIHDFKLIFVSISLIGILLITTPALSNFIRAPNQELFSELYILGPKHIARTILLTSLQVKIIQCT